MSGEVAPLELLRDRRVQRVAFSSVGDIARTAARAAYQVMYGARRAGL